jgi:hypothetical protein
VLSDYERVRLTAHYDAIVLEAMANCCDEDWFGVQIGDRMFDLNAWIDEDTGKLVCTVYECDRVNGNWQTNCRHSWTLTEDQGE